MNTKVECKSIGPWPTSTGAATLDGADLRDVVGWNEVSSVSYASVEGIQHPPAGFLPFALARFPVIHIVAK